jgi:hypothetical protein
VFGLGSTIFVMMKGPIVVDHSAWQSIVHTAGLPSAFTDGLSDVPQQTPRRKSGGGTQTEVTRAQSVAELDVMASSVGVSMVGGVSPRQILPFHVLPDAHSAVAVALLISTALL